MAFFYNYTSDLIYILFIFAENNELCVGKVLNLIFWMKCVKT